MILVKYCPLFSYFPRPLFALLVDGIQILTFPAIIYEETHTSGAKSLQELSVDFCFADEIAVFRRGKSYFEFKHVPLKIV